MALKKMPGKFRMPGFNPGVGTRMGNSLFNSNGPAYGGDGRSWAEAAADSGGTDVDSNLDMIVKNQRDYEAKMKKEAGGEWNKREDNAWKVRQNKINELLGSSKRYEVESGSARVVDNQFNIPFTDEVKTKDLVKNTETGDKDKNKQNIGTNEAGEEVVTMNKDVDKDDEGTVKLKQDFDEETGKVIKVKGYSAGKKRPGAKAYKANQKLKAERNRLEIKINKLEEGSKRRLRLEEKLKNMPTPKSDKEMKDILEGMGTDVATASGDALKE